MSDTGVAPRESFPDTHHDVYTKTVFGFWIYLLTDFMMFGSFFAAYAVLRTSTFGGPSGHLLFNLPFTLFQTLLLLTSSLTSGLAGAYAHRKNRSMTLLFFVLTLLLGIAFMGMEGMELNKMISAGNTWRQSAFLSMFFTLIGTHQLHVFFAIVWTIALLVPVWREGLQPESLRRLTCLRMFWQFINIVWVFIFAIVYVMGGD